jgi:glutamate dehydrogenase
MFEIFVYSPRVEGVHLRFGPVARGGLRWSDRREDFRTEILGLVKAQMVKNAVIVPVGAKGGFVVKRPPADAATNRDAYLAEGIECYKTFISGLLDLTDNLVAGEVVPPKNVVRHDGDDTYLVVAADKGTATFSDIANEVSKAYGFWLGDAFASGGSVGYDHKAMGITARGAWESVKRHFREMGVDCQKEDFTVIGIGDMSGDVFGNGMLLSEHIRLIAAFDHRHIFLDPDPDPVVSFAERRRLFELPRSSWADYDPQKISPGGGVYARKAKSIPISEQVRESLDLDASVTALTPNELLHAILLAPVDLLWNGGIGTYVKSSLESHADVGDKANDSIRVNGNELRVRCVGEGGNLGFTQLGRIEYALGGGRINTDAIDNSAGVDCSDHEVNIKILLNRVVADGDLTEKQRNLLLAEMTDEVAELVLRDNYEQNVAISNSLAQASSLLHVHQAYLRWLEKKGLLNRELEFLPSDKQLAQRRSEGIGLTAPEFAVLLAYTKIWLDREVLASDLPDDEALRTMLHGYFPTPLRDRYAERIQQHPLRREIISTSAANHVVNTAGTTFVYRLSAETGGDTSDILRAHLLAYEVFDLAAYERAVEALDNTVPAAVQTRMRLEARRLAERGARWLLQNRRMPLDISKQLAFFREGVAEVVALLPKVCEGEDLETMQRTRDELVMAGVPVDLAGLTAAMNNAYSAFDIVEVARDAARPVDEVAEVYFYLADAMSMTALLARINALPRDDRWKTMARAALREDLFSAHAGLTHEVLTAGDAHVTPAERFAAWQERSAGVVAKAQQTFEEIAASETWDLAMMSVALRTFRTLLRSTSRE